jgi:prefoldin subunit 5
MEHIEIKAQIGGIQLQLEELQARANALVTKKNELTQALYKEMSKPKVQKDSKSK